MSAYYEDATVAMHHGDCLDVLTTLPDASVDAVVTDPPYGLEFMGDDWDGAGDVARANRGTQTAWKRPPGENATSDKFQLPAPAFDLSPTARISYQTWCEEWAWECFRALKPGGHMLAFGGTRTGHRLACAVEDAGFEIRDSIAWLYGSGFPKSLNLVDGAGNRTGWGTALKPAHESIVVARKPLVGTVAATVLAHGTGALNIAATRIDIDQGPAGRWPANVVLDESQAEALSSSSFFYVAKASTSERVRVDGIAHPTVKPLALMRWLVRLVTPAGGIVLEPFAGSGTTVEACILEGFRCIAIERDADYLPLITQRIHRRRDPVASTRGEDRGLLGLLDLAPTCYRGDSCRSVTCQVHAPEVPA